MDEENIRADLRRFSGKILAKKVECEIVPAPAVNTELLAEALSKIKNDFTVVNDGAADGSTIEFLCGSGHKTIEYVTTLLQIREAVCHTCKGGTKFSRLVLGALENLLGYSLSIVSVFIPRAKKIEYINVENKIKVTCHDIKGTSFSSVENGVTELTFFYTTSRAKIQKSAASMLGMSKQQEKREALVTLPELAAINSNSTNIITHQSLCIENCNY